MDLLTGLGIGAAALLGYKVVLEPKAAPTPARVAIGAKKPPVALGGNPTTQTGAPLAGALIGLGTTLIGSGTTIAQDIYKSASSSPADYSTGYVVPSTPAEIAAAQDPSLTALNDPNLVVDEDGFIYEV
jgi:hypothetical protein